MNLHGISYSIAETTEEILSTFITQFNLSPEENNVTEVFETNEVTFTGLKVNF